MTQVNQRAVTSKHLFVLVFVSGVAHNWNVVKQQSKNLGKYTFLYFLPLIDFSRSFSSVLYGKCMILRLSTPWFYIFF